MISLVALAIAIVACDGDRDPLSNGLCTKLNRHLSDREFVEIALRERETDAWRHYSSPAAFVDDNGGCCEVFRYPTETDWNRGSDDSDPEDRIGRTLESLGPSRYLVFVRLRYVAPSLTTNTLEVTIAGYPLGACGDVVGRGYRVSAPLPPDPP